MLLRAHVFLDVVRLCFGRGVYDVQNTGTYSRKGMVSHPTRPESPLYYYFLISTGSIRSYHAVFTDRNNNLTHHLNLRTGRGKPYNLCHTLSRMLDVNIKTSMYSLYISKAQYILKV
jgi:hypothetical protein